MIMSATSAGLNRADPHPIAACPADVQTAVRVLRRGGVIAYATESCFGLGCDPSNERAIRRLLAIKRRSYRKGLILIAANIQQIKRFADMRDLPYHEAISQSWPGPNTWLVPPTKQVSQWVRGRHANVAVRATAHDGAATLCQAFGGALISTSANWRGQAALKNYFSVKQHLGHQLDFVLPGNIGLATKPSIIRDGISGAILRE